MFKFRFVSTSIYVFFQLIIRYFRINKNVNEYDCTCNHYIMIVCVCISMLSPLIYSVFTARCSKRITGVLVEKPSPHIF